MRLLVLLGLVALSGAGCTDASDNARRTEQFQAQEIQFLTEKKGRFEDEVKSALLPLLQSRPELRQAFLVAVAYNSSEQSVALCLESSGSNRKALVEDIRGVFSRVAGTNAHMDIIFLTAEQQGNVLRVAKPFYVAS
jgi:hypothetical protein